MPRCTLVNNSNGEPAGLVAADRGVDFPQMLASNIAVGLRLLQIREAAVVGQGPAHDGAKRPRWHLHARTAVRQLLH